MQLTASLSLYLIFCECMDQETDVNHLQAAVPTVQDP
jgi:hypothetical protein